MFDTKDYKELPGVSKSQLNDLINDPYLFYLAYIKLDEKVRKEVLDKKTKSTVLGDMVDAILTAEKTLTDYIYVSAHTVGDSLKAVVDHVFQSCQSVINPNDPQMSELNYWEQFIKDSLMINSYYDNWKPETRFADVIKKGSDYFSDLFKSINKQIVSIDQYNIATTVAENMKFDKATNPYVMISKEDMKEDQLALLGEYNGVKLKGLIDRAIFKPGKLIQPIDFKTSQNPERFVDSYIKYEYFKQGAFYDLLFKQNYPGYTILPFKFVVGFTECYTSDESNPSMYPRSAVYTMNTSDYDFALKGGRALNGTIHTGLFDAINLYGAYEKNNWEIDLSTKIPLPLLTEHNEERIQTFPEDSEVF